MAYASFALAQLTLTVIALPETVARPLETTVGALTYALVEDIRSTSTLTEPPLTTVPSWLEPAVILVRRPVCDA
jgi:hypothetical protein